MEHYSFDPLSETPRQIDIPARLLGICMLLASAVAVIHVIGWALQFL
jgi:hypothetical protein